MRRVSKIIYGHDFDIVDSARFHKGARDIRADSAISVNRDIDGHDLCCTNRPSTVAQESPCALWTSNLAVSAIRSAVKPKCGNSALAGADSPKPSMPMTVSSRPTI